MGRIVLSYRRDDSEAVTGRLFDRLAAHYGRDAVFRDVDSISVGSDYRVQVDKALRQARIFLPIIGRRWRGSGRAGRSRLEDEQDPVRIEIETALRHGIPVIPILVGTTRMPSLEQMPEPLRAIVYLQACRIDPGQDFDHHTDRLIGQMDRFLGAAGASPGSADAAAAPAPPQPAPERRYGISFGTGAASVVAETAPAAWGGYARASVSHYPGTYLVLRPTFARSGNVYAYLADIAWDAQEGGLVFQERSRPDQRHSQEGRIWIPNPSVHLYLVSGKDGWLRAVTLSFLNAAEEMSGIISTLHNVGGASYVPVAAPIVFAKRATLDGDGLGEITPDDPHHAGYVEALRRAVATGTARLVGI